MNIELWNCKRVEENSVLAPRCRSLFRLTRFRLFLWASNGKRDPYRCAIVRFAFLFRSPMPPPPPLTPSSVLFAICIFFDSFAVYRFYLIECCWIRAQRERQKIPHKRTHIHNGMIWKSNLLNTNSISIFILMRLFTPAQPSPTFSIRQAFFSRFSSQACTHFQEWIHNG